VATWVLTITRNLAVDFLRLRRAVSTDPADDLWAGLVAPAHAPDELAELAEARSRVSTALAAIPPEQSRALVLSAVLGYSASEISRLEGIPLGTAKTRVRRGLMKLREILNERATAS
jgi:RNA polymerase sigma factor (sigma-70 family)